MNLNESTVGLRETENGVCDRVERPEERKQEIETEKEKGEGEREWEIKADC